MVTDCGARKSFFEGNLHLPFRMNSLIYKKKQNESRTSKMHHNSWKRDFKI